MSLGFGRWLCARCVSCTHRHTVRAFFGFWPDVENFFRGGFHSMFGRVEKLSYRGVLEPLDFQ